MRASEKKNIVCPINYFLASYLYIYLGYIICYCFSSILIQLFCFNAENEMIKFGFINYLASVSQ